MIVLLSILVLLVFVVVEIVTSWIFVHGSKTHHPDLWAHAGRPTLMGKGGFILSWPLAKYLWKRKYSNVDNQASIAFAERLRVLYVTSYAAVRITGIWAIVSIYVFGMPE